MQTFDEAIANFTDPNEAPLAALKKTFEPTLADLRALQLSYPKRKAAWLARVAHVQQRQQQAVARGVRYSPVADGLEELTGGRALHGGLLHATEHRISGSIFKIERLSPRDLPQRNAWISWYSDPQFVRDNMAQIERTLAQLEDLVKDGGKVQQMVEAQSAQPPASSMTTQRHPDRPAAVPEEQDFSL